MYVHQTHKGPRGGQRLVEYFDDLQAARLDVEDEDGGVLRIRTADGHIDLSMGSEELRVLGRAFAQLTARADRGDKPRRRKPRIVPGASSSPVRLVAPLSAWDRLLQADLLDHAEVQP